MFQICHRPRPRSSMSRTEGQLRTTSDLEKKDDSVVCKSLAERIFLHLTVDAEIAIDAEPRMVTSALLH